MNIVLFVILSAIIVFAYLLWQNLSLPRNLGVKDGHLPLLPGSPNGVSTQTDDPRFHVEPLPFDNTLAQSMAGVKGALQEYGGVTIVTEAENYLHAVQTTPIFRFKDDLEFYFDTAHKLIHFRSASRVGYSDFGLNRQRYSRITKLYRAKTTIAQ